MLNFLHLFISFKNDFHVDAERIPRNVERILLRFFFQNLYYGVKDLPYGYLKIFHLTIKVAQYYYLFTLRTRDAL